MKWILSLIIGVVFVGCGSYTPPKVYNIEKSKYFNLEYDVVWSKLISWFGSQGTPIKNMDKLSGFIFTEIYSNNDNVSLNCDCGESSMTTVFYKNKYENSLNIIIEKTNNNQIKVTINTFFTAGIMKFNGKWNDSRINCNSTGKLEKELFDYISK